MIQKILQVMERARETGGVTARTVVGQSGLAYASVMRWRRRQMSGEPVIRRAGPKKVAPLELSMLRQEVYNLKHRRKRSVGTTALYERHRESVSRREVARLTAAVRRQLKETHQTVQWHSPGVVWSLDETEYDVDDARKDQILQVQDLSSGYKFDPLTAERNHGAEIAAHLQGLFERFGPPLFLKRDNGGNLNHHLVEDVMERWYVIPLNSPCYYPPYNGGIERAQGELHKALRCVRTSFDGPAPAALLARQAVHDLNHTPRRRLKGRNSCCVFHEESKNHRFNKRQRKEVYDWIKRKASSIMKQHGGPSARNFNNAWRVAVKMWLQQHGHITVVTGKPVLPDFQKILSRN